MTHQFEVAAVVLDVQDPDRIQHLLRQFGTDVRIVHQKNVTVFVSRECAKSEVWAIASFMRDLACARVIFEYICIGDAKDAILGYQAALEGLDAMARPAA